MYFGGYLTFDSTFLLLLSNKYVLVCSMYLLVNCLTNPNFVKWGNASRSLSSLQSWCIDQVIWVVATMSALEGGSTPGKKLTEHLINFYLHLNY